MERGSLLQAPAFSHQGQRYQRKCFQAYAAPNGHSSFTDTHYNKALPPASTQAPFPKRVVFSSLLYEVLKIFTLFVT